MKKCLIAGLFAAALALGGAELIRNGSFEDWKGDVPADWEVNTAFKGGTLRNGGGTVAITTDKAPFALMADKLIPGKAGDILTITIRYRGKGRFSAGLYCYGATGAWVGKNLDAYGTPVDAADWMVWREKLTVPALTHPKTGDVLAKIRPMLTVAPGSSLEFDDYSITVGGEAAAPAAPTAVKAAAPVTGAPLPFQLTKRIYAVEGQECNIYFDNLAKDREGAFDVVTPLGRLDEARWRFIPDASQAGTHTVTVRLLDKAGGMLESASTELVVSKAAAAPKPVSVLLIGDSLTDAGVYPARLLELLQNSGFEAKLIGSHAGKGRAVGADGVAHEGRGGWTFENYLSRNNSGDDYRARSPFLAASGSGVDFKAYFAKYNKGLAPDVITFFLGCNDIFSATPETLAAAVARSLSAAEQLVSAARAAAPDALIGLAVLPPPAASQDAFGSNYGTKFTRSGYLLNRRAFVDALIAKYENDQRVSLIPTHLNLDCENNYPSVMEPVSAGSDKTVRRLNNGVHPDKDGYRQIGDTFYAWIRGNLK